ncbi:metal-dependent hydrolase [Vibrio metoecus]|uniref:alanyl-tRNA editing protein n=1 Tax=Vibrio TaxID=662 RepID=UPI0006D7D4D6|nr:MULTISPECIES: alanyl-tRNA editing protein [Vibrio]KQB00033.1 metal-dependent hydrolase [Vibrio metoecus]MDP4492276.1 alanyl-tRNA editing protein [Vibrio sp. AH4]PAR35633.1 metal-dependent hydrolase [Vibrio metoecus]PAR44917.1 metal-dependent hydrolase [Vibrio metoecus]PAR46931.1 metal-dependent hydrolase [Vibrio metoecus]
MSYCATEVTFPQGITALDTQIMLCQPHSAGVDVVTDKTPFHPVSHIWPDHPADRGVLIWQGNEYPVTACLVGVIEQASGHLYVGNDIPVKRDESGWLFVVVHRLNSMPPALKVGESVKLVVDAQYQASLSRGHSAGHLAYLALNKVLAQNYWRKDADRKDPHGYFDFNSYAQISSFVTPDCSTDLYRLGKTLRKRGLNSDDVLKDLDLIEENTNQQLMQWLALSSSIHIECEGTTLTDSRYWVCDLHEGAPARIPCGGTHVNGLEAFRLIKVVLKQVDEQHIEAITYIEPARLEGSF